MSNDEKVFPRGLFVSAPRPSAPDFVKGRISIRVEDFISFLAERADQEWLRIDIKEGFKEDEEGNKKWYSQVDTWQKPEAHKPSSGGSDGLPF